jgi:hypothetical protein
MKKLFIIIGVGLFAVTSHAQDIVYDPTMNIEQIADQAANIAKYVQMVNNQIQQLQQLEQYNKVFGDPAQLLNITGVSRLTADLSKTTVGKTIAAVEQSADGVDALAYDANGLFHQIGETFTTPSGNKIKREATDYKPFEAINNATANYTNVTADVSQRRQKLKEDIAATTRALQAAMTASEVQKLTGVLIGQSAALAAIDKEVDQAVAISVVQDIENRNDAQKQIAAAAEQRKAEVIEAFSNYRTNFPLNVQPPLFPTSTP